MYILNKKIILKGVQFNKKYINTTYSAFKFNTGMKQPKMTFYYVIIKK